MFTMRTMSREIGTALAVLAIYLLTVLAPIHQARASQLAFEELGYATTQSSWVLCTPAGTIGQDQDITVSKCPAAGVGKDEMVLPLLDIAPIGHDLLALAAQRRPQASLAGSSDHYSTSGIGTGDST